MKALFKGLLGGGSAYVYLAVFGAGIAFWIHYQDVKSDRDRYEQERDAAKAEVFAKDQTIASQARTGERRSQSNADQSRTEEAIHAVPDTIHCAASEPIAVALGVLRNRAAKQSADSDDE